MSGGTFNITITIIIEVVWAGAACEMFFGFFSEKYFQSFLELGSSAFHVTDVVSHLSLFYTGMFYLSRKKWPCRKEKSDTFLRYVSLIKSQQCQLFNEETRPCRIATWKTWVFDARASCLPGGRFRFERFPGRTPWKTRWYSMFIPRRRKTHLIAISSLLKVQCPTPNTSRFPEYIDERWRSFDDMLYASYRMILPSKHRTPETRSRPLK